MAVYKSDMLVMDLNGSIQVNAGKLLGEDDKQGDKIGVIIRENGADVSLSGFSCVGLFNRIGRGETVNITGTVSGSEAYVILPQACYAYEGAFDLVLKMSNGTDTSTVRIVRGTVVNTQMGIQIDPGHEVPDLTELLALISRMENIIDQAPKFEETAERLEGNIESVKKSVEDLVQFSGRIENLMENAKITDGYWVNKNGTIMENATSAYAEIEVDDRKEFLFFSFADNYSTFNTSGRGAFTFVGSNAEKIAAVGVDQYLQTGKYKDKKYAKIPIPQGSVMARFTIKLSSTWDARETAAAAYYDLENIVFAEGEAVRIKGSPIADTENRKRVDEIIGALVPVYEKIRTELTEKRLISAKGVVTEYDNSAFKVTEYIDVSEYKQIRVSCSANYSNASICFYAEDKTFLSKPFPASGSSADAIHINETVDVPDGAKYVIAATSTSTVVPSVAYQKGYKAGQSMTGKKWCCIGDSLTEYNSRTTLHYFDYIAEETGIEIVNMGRSGTGYKRQEENNRAFYQRVMNVPTDCDVYTIFGSGNDQSYFAAMGSAGDTGTETLAGCINTTIDNILNVVPTAHLGIVAPCPWASYNPASENNGMERYTELLRQICKRRSIPFMDLYHASNLRPWDPAFRAIAYDKDTDDGGITYNGVHPNEIGHKILAGRFKVFVESLI